MRERETDTAVMLKSEHIDWAQGEIKTVEVASATGSQIVPNDQFNRFNNKTTTPTIQI